MDTILSTGPGFFEAETNETNKNVPKGKMRFYCAKLETYDFEEGPELQTQFHILAAKGDKSPEVADALLRLGRHIESNKSVLEASARRYQK